MENHHLETRRKSDKTKEICRECHKTIHGLFSNRMLRDEERALDTIDGLLRNRRFYKAVKFIRKLDVGKSMKMRSSAMKKHHQ
ncbi:MAG TPA: hypothetical protein VE868_01190 [Balneolaceae bacterium]|nr:hypothetical protein [Balneolaceae bacterium]